ncbi:hypothetical protein [Naasia aerilata]|uniref:hypothetical protein n=1 Tax=Naasia aerilata TaxID=1162966 RepID=UPI0025726DBE|nr:hypothetical protein [Naasia aerilata]
MALVVGRSALVRSEAASLLDEVDALWGSGAYAGVAEAVVAMLPAGAAVRVVDVGADLGHVAEAVRSARSDADVLVVSSSPGRLVRAMGRAGAEGVLVDPVRALPVRDGVAGVVLCAFGAHRPAEFHRVLAGGGVLLLAVDAFQVGAVDDDLYPWFEHDQTRIVAETPGEGVAVLRYRRRRRPITW